MLSLKNAVSSGMLPFLAGNAILGTIGVFVHAAHADPLTTAAFRCAFGALGLTVWVLARHGVRALRLQPRDLPRVFAAAVLLVASWALFFAAMARIPTGIAVLLFQTQPLWVLLLGAWCLGEAIVPRRLAAVGVAMVGLVLTTGGFGGWTGAWLGVGACLLGALCTAAVTVIAKRLQALPTGVLAWWQCAIGAAVLVPWAQPGQGAAWAWLAGLGLMHTGLAYTLMYLGMAGPSAGRIAVWQFAYPLVAVGVDVVCFGQRLDGAQVAGLALMGAAMAVAERTPKGRPRAEPGPVAHDPGRHDLSRSR